MEDLIAKYLFDELTPKEEKLLLDWISESPENAETFVHSKRMLSLSDSYTNSFKPDSEKAWLKVKLKALTPIAALFKDQLRSVFTGTRVLSIAASFIVLCGLIYTFSSVLSPGDYIDRSVDLVEVEVMQSVEMIEVIAGDQVKIVHLPDNSLAFLNKYSKLTYPSVFDNDNRIVSLDGESFFEVKRDPLHPFYVLTENTRTRVLGTSFNVKAYQNDIVTEVTVASGKVVFFLEGTRKDRMVVLESNDKATFNKQKVDVLKTRNESNDYLAWLDNLESNFDEELSVPDPESIAGVRSSREVIYGNEKANPTEYLNNVCRWTNTFNWNKKLIKKTLVEGQIYNSAIIAYYHEISLKATFYNLDDVIIGTEVFLVRQEIAPGDIIRYQHKLDKWYDVTSKVIVEIEKADSPTISLYKD
ncbi:MAG: hypothetical protein COB85_08160 [Bacteroidetes bacterium]|nr:MAG: hypothetical protein COB85_08160 [Bacteroidota bacterium]